MRPTRWLSGTLYGRYWSCFFFNVCKYVWSFTRKSKGERFSLYSPCVLLFINSKERMLSRHNDQGKMWELIEYFGHFVCHIRLLQIFLFFGKDTLASPLMIPTRPAKDLRSLGWSLWKSLMMVRDLWDYFMWLIGALCTLFLHFLKDLSTTLQGKWKG